MQAQQLVALQGVAGHVSLHAYAHALHYMCYFWHHAAALLYSHIHKLTFYSLWCIILCHLCAQYHPKVILEAWKICVLPYFNVRMVGKESEISCTSTKNA